MLTADQTQSIKDLLPKVTDFLNKECRSNFTTQEVKEMLTATFEDGYITGMVKMEVFTLFNTEGLRVQYGSAHKYFKIRSR